MRKLILILALFFSGCYLKQYPVNATVAESATYKLFSNEESQGTVWAVNRHYMVTAGHMCEYFGDAYVATSSKERRIRLHTVAWEKSHDDSQIDLCLLKSEAPLPNYLVISDRMPMVGEHMGYVGYPNGNYLESEGKYLGDVDGADNQWNDYAFSAPTDHGASGSALYIDRGVWGVLVRVRTDGGFLHDGTDGGVAIPLDKLTLFLVENDVKFVTTPDDPTQMPDMND